MTPFPPDFRWGTATAAYQIEGAVHEDGREPSIWDTFSHTPGKVARGETGDRACDHYHRTAEDIAIMRELGIGTYRFSVAWPRIQPTGSGPLNPAGIDFYDRLIDQLLAADIAPWLTLYHWDLPQPLEDKGGWPLRDTAMRFADYAVAVHEKFADRVTDWTTLNEPWCTAFLGYFNGVHAPGRREPQAALRAVHHLLLGHGIATTAMREAAPARHYGITVNLYPVEPLRDHDADHDAARRVEGWSNRIFTDPLLTGRYPADLLDDIGRLWPSEAVRDEDLEVISTPLDVLGVNYYTRHIVRGGGRTGAAAGTGPGAGTGSAAPRDWPGCDDVEKVMRGRPQTTMGWEIDPDGLYDILTWLDRTYPELPPLYVTENGASFTDTVTEDASGNPVVHDPQRVDYLARHFAAAARAIADGVDLRGYFVWSLLDNFEWAEGYRPRFGLVHVDYDTQERVIKDSGRYVARVAAGEEVPG